MLVIMNVRVIQHGEYAHQAAMICANHISWLDIPVIGSQIPTYFLSKAELRQIPIVGWMAHQAGTLFIKRGAGEIGEVRSLIEDYLSRDHCLTFFPEATTGNGYGLRQFHPRLFAAAIDSQTPVLPVALSYHCASQPELTIAFGDESLGANLWRVLGRWRTDVHLTLLPLQSEPQQTRRQLADKSMHLIADALNLPAQRRGLDLRAPMPEGPAAAPPPENP
ncbi:acyltransferase domain protein [Reinekea blandensis MED297]|uniref:Acyltransferase domain protein n=2 Tax=Reinekea TaxID=230494 RepID=A4BEA7_9GAMM|nr:acyltransferase domain protein [Reinekea blandensis MED297]